MNTHSWRTVLGLAIIAIIGGLQAIHNQVPWGGVIDTVVAVLLVIEHGVNGNVN